MALVAAAGIVAGLAWKSGILTKPMTSATAQISAPVAPEKLVGEKPVAEPSAAGQPPAASTGEKTVSATAQASVEVAKPEPAKPQTTQPTGPAAPSFDTVRVEQSGDAVIAGRAEPGSDVTALLNGMVIATAKAGPDGSFVMIPEKPLPAGTGALTLQSITSGAALSSVETVAVNIKPKPEAPAQTAASASKQDATTKPAQPAGNTVAMLSPTEPTKILQAPTAPSDSVTLDAVDYDSSGNIVFSGRAAPNSTVRIYVDNAPLADAVADDKGKWSFSGKSDIAPGNHQLRADQLASDGKVSSRVELPFTREEPAKVVEAAKPEDGAKPADVPTIQKITIQPGNNLWKLSRQLYGHGNRYTVIFEANKDAIRNPDLIYPGQILTAPQKANSN